MDKNTIVRTLGLIDPGIKALPKYSVGMGMRLFALISEGLTDEEIAKVLDVPAQHVSVWILRYKLQSIRERESNIEFEEETQRVQLKQRALWNKRIGAEAASLAVEGMDLVRGKMNDGDARGFGDSAKAVNTLVQLTRQAEGMDNEAKAKQGGMNINLFVARIGDNIKDTAPAIDIQATPVPDVSEFD